MLDQTLVLCSLFTKCLDRKQLTVKGLKCTCNFVWCCIQYVRIITQIMQQKQQQLLLCWCQCQLFNWNLLQLVFFFSTLYLDFVTLTWLQINTQRVSSREGLVSSKPNCCVIKSVRLKWTLKLTLCGQRRHVLMWASVDLMSVCVNSQNQHHDASHDPPGHGTYRGALDHVQRGHLLICERKGGGGGGWRGRKEG